MARPGNVRVSITATGGESVARESAQAEAGLGKLHGKATGAMGGIASAAKMAAGAAGVGAVVFALKDCVEAATEAEKVDAKRDAQMKALGLSTRKYASEIENVIAKQSAMSGFDDEALTEAFTRLVRSTGNVGKALDLNNLAMDVARAKGTDVASAAALVGKAYDGNANAFRKLGVTVKPVTEAQDKLTASGVKGTAQQLAAAKAADKQATAQAALAEAQRKFGGQAKAYGDTAAGAQERLGVALENVQEKVGALALPAIKAMADGVSKFADDARAGKGAAGDIAHALGDVGKFAKDAWPTLKALAGVSMDALAGTFHTLAGVIGVVKNVVKGIGQVLRGDFGGALSSLGEVAKSGMDVVVGVLQQVTAPIRAAMKAIGAPVEDVGALILNTFADIVRTVADVAGALSDIPGMGWLGDLEDSANGAAGSIDGLAESLKGVKAPPPVMVKADADAARDVLAGIQSTKLRDKVARILGDNTSAHDKIEAIRALGIPAKAARVLGKVGDALSGIDHVSRQMDLLDGKTAKVFVGLSGSGQVRVKAAGGGANDGGLALIGEGGGPEHVVNRRTGAAYTTTGPMLVDLSADDYVIPTESRYRANAHELVRSLAADLRVPGFAAGAHAAGKPKGKPKPPRFTPSERAYQAHPSDWYEAEHSDLQTRAQARDKKNRRTPDAVKASHKLRDLNAVYRRWKSYATRIERQEKLADNYATVMRAADSRDDQAAYATAWGKRQDALKRARDLLDGALAVSPNSTSVWHLTMQGERNSLDADLAEMGHSAGSVLEEGDKAYVPDPESPDQLLDDAITAVDDLEYAGVITAEEARKRRHEIRQGAVSATPTFGKLSEHARLRAIGDDARDVAAKPDASGPTADDSAALDQANNRASIAQRAANLSAAWVQAVGGGIFGPGQGGGIQVTQHINALTSGDPDVLRAVGQAAVGGMGLQGFIPSSRQGAL